MRVRIPRKTGFFPLWLEIQRCNLHIIRTSRNSTRQPCFGGKSVGGYRFGLEYFPSEAGSLFHNESDTRIGDITVDEVVQYIASKRIPAITVYVISTAKPEQEDKLKKLFAGIPCRFIRLINTDFYALGQLPYENIGVDRVAAARGVTCYPALILDGGTAMTTTALDEKGRIMGGGISPGLNSKFRAMNEHCHALPKIEPAMVKKFCNEAGKGLSLPLPVIAGNTEDAMLGGVLKETALYVNAIAQYWLKKFLDISPTDLAPKVPPAGKDPVDAAAESDTPLKENGGLKPAPEMATATILSPLVAAAEIASTQKLNLIVRPNEMKPQIYVTGSDGPLLTAMLSPQVKRLVEWGEHDRYVSEKALIHSDSYLLHRGIRNILYEKRPTDELKKLKEGLFELDSTKRLSLIGQRVAKKFSGHSDESGDAIFRGVVVHGVVYSGKSLEDDIFAIAYDDGDWEESGVESLYGKLLFVLVGSIPTSLFAG
jgi:pantothenate kinase type III